MTKQQTLQANSVQELAAYLIDPDIKIEHEANIIDRLHEVFSELAIVSGFDGEEGWKHDVQTSSGMAIGVNEAARCLLDYRRTGQFFRGLYAAIREAKRLFPKETIKVLYAGCGPYAPFLTLIAPQFLPGEVVFSLIEINGESLEIAKALVAEFGLQDYLQDTFLADATLLQVPAAKDYHILFTETMDTALEREPMVPILLNLLPQLRPNVLVLPRNVTIEGVFFSHSELPNGIDILWELTSTIPGHSIGTVMDMAEALETYLDLEEKDGIFHELQCELPPQEYRDFFALYTTVEVWEGIFLYKNESDITDLRVRDLKDLPPCDYINFEYLLGEELELLFGVS
ncbi:MAG: hypothetical protein GC192_06885 [Bacteroidetes bacterium]|nr:hypothetical protein [Bacteroidota bacterium]